MNQFLEARKHWHERLKAGIDIHPNDNELSELQKMAHAIYPKYPHVSKSCVNDLIRFVFEKQGVVVKRERLNQRKKPNG